MGEGAVGLLVMVGFALLVGTMFVLGFVQLILHLKRKDLQTDESMESVIPKGQIAKTVYLNPCFMLFVLVCSAGIVMDLLKISL